MRLVRLPLITNFATSLGSERERNALILEYESNGIRAYAECVTSDTLNYAIEDNVTAIHLIRDHLAGVLKTEPSPDEFLKQSKRIRGNNMAKAAVEMLLWDYHAKAKGESIVRALGSSKGYADTGIALGVEKPEIVLRRVGEAVRRGYKRIKVKVERGIEYEVIAKIRDTYPEIPLSADANGDYTLKDIDMLRRLDKFGLVYLEQPLGYDDLLDHSRLAKQISTPICLDESISSVAQARLAVEMEATKVINVKPGRLGGLSNSLVVAKIARNRDCHVWVGGMLETGIGRAFNVALGSLRIIDMPGDTSPNEEYFERDIVKNTFKMKRGRVTPNPGPGTGVEIDRTFLQRSTERTWRIF